MKEEMGKQALSRETRGESGEPDKPEPRPAEGVSWAVGCMQRVVRGESCIFNPHCVPSDTSSDLVWVPCGLRRRNITLKIYYV